MKRLLFVLLTFIGLGIEVRAQQAINNRLTAYLPQDSAKVSVIVCPGGSYSWLDMKSEGTMVAQWLQQQGIAAFVLRYPVQGVMSYILHYRLLVRGHQYPDALDCLQKTLVYLREHAAEYHINPDCIGCMGFSAGGHLVVNAAESFTAKANRPDFVASVYPVVTLGKTPWTHKKSRRALLGEYRKRNALWQDSLSLEKHVRPDMPPVFLVNCLDDPKVHYHNSELLDSALTAQGIMHEYHQYATGRHGFGANPKRLKGKESSAWLQSFLVWIRKFHD